VLEPLLLRRGAKREAAAVAASPATDAS
jgi:hypothetical protein